MAEDRWGETVHTEGGWAVGSDRFTTIRVGREFALDKRSAIFYEQNLPELRLFTWLLLDNLAIQERASRPGTRPSVPDDHLDTLIERLDHLRAELVATQQAVPSHSRDQGEAG